MYKNFRRNIVLSLTVTLIFVITLGSSSKTKKAEAFSVSDIFSGASVVLTNWRDGGSGPTFCLVISFDDGKINFGGSIGLGDSLDGALGDRGLIGVPTVSDFDKLPDTDKARAAILSKARVVFGDESKARSACPTGSRDYPTSTGPGGSIGDAGDPSTYGDPGYGGIGDISGGTSSGSSGGSSGSSSTGGIPATSDDVAVGLDNTPPDADKACAYVSGNRFTAEDQRQLICFYSKRVQQRFQRGELDGILGITVDRIQQNLLDWRRVNGHSGGRIPLLVFTDLNELNSLSGAGGRANAFTRFGDGVGRDLAGSFASQGQGINATGLDSVDYYVAIWDNNMSRSAVEGSISHEQAHVHDVTAPWSVVSRNSKFSFNGTYTENMNFARTGSGTWSVGEKWGNCFSSLDTLASGTHSYTNVHELYVSTYLPSKFNRTALENLIENGGITEECKKALNAMTSDQDWLNRQSGGDNPPGIEV